MASHSPTHKSKEEKEKRKSAAKAKIRAIGMVQAAFKRAQQRQGTESPEPVNSGEEPRLTWRERMAERAKERGGTTARGGDETARSSRTFSDPPSDPQSTHQWQARKLEERAKVEKRRKEEARALTRRDADRRARSSDRGQDPFEAELDRMSDAEAMNRLDDVPISDLDTDYSSDERGASRRGGRARDGQRRFGPRRWTHADGARDGTGGAREGRERGRGIIRGGASRETGGEEGPAAGAEASTAAPRL